MAAEAMNPYEPPRTESRERLIVADDEILIARFPMTPPWKHSIAHALIMPGALWLTSAMLVLLVVMAAVMGLLVRRIPNDDLLLKSLAMSLVAGGSSAVAYHIGVHRLLRNGTLRRMAAYPVLSADGEWLVEIDERDLRLTTAAGSATWPLDAVWWHPVRDRFVLVQLPGDLPLGIPQSADCERLTFEDFQSALRKRTRPPGLNYFFRAAE